MPAPTRQTDDERADDELIADPGEAPFRRGELGYPLGLDDNGGPFEEVPGPS